MPYVQYKSKTGALHIGGGRFFYANQPVEVSADEQDELVEKYDDLEVVDAPKDHSDADSAYTAASLKKLNATKQKEIIAGYGEDPEGPKNEDERIALILKLQD